MPVSLRLFLPESWTSNAARLEHAGVPEEHHAFRTKPQIALAGIDRVIERGLSFGVVLADAGYGLSALFRQGLSKRGLDQKIYPAGVALIFPMAGRGRARKRHVPDTPSVAAEAMLADARWSAVSWRRGTNGRLTAQFTATRVRAADGPPQRIGNKSAQHMPGEEGWLVGEHRPSGEQKYYLSNLPADADLKPLAATIKARWICEQAHQQLKEELGLNHFEGRSWTGLRRHALMTFAFLQHQRPAAAGRGKKSQRTAASTKLTGRKASHQPAPDRTPPAATLPALPPVPPVSPSQS